MEYIKISNLYKSYNESNGRNIQVLEDMNLDIKKGEFISIFGPNACGKTTLLNIIAGLIDIDKGSVTVDGKEPSKVKVGFVFQDYNDSLFPWLKNIDNIAFSLKSSFGPKKKRREYISNYVKEMELEELPLEKYPYQCSGGQQQLVALIRELIYDPDVLLLDEPFASLDFDRRISQQEQLLDTWEKTHSTIVFVSHEIDEALLLADKLILLSQRPATIVDIYNIDLPRPRNIEMYEKAAFFKLKVPILHKFREIIGK